MSEPTSSSFPNRSQYMTPVMSGAGLALVGSFIPVLNYLNVFLFWYILGGVLAGYMLRQRAASASLGEAAAVGALSGLVSSVVITLFISLFGCIFWVVLLADAPHRDEGLIAVGGVVIFVVMWFLALVVQPLAGALGGLIAGAIWPPTAASGADVVPPTPEELEARKAKRTKVLRILGGLGAGCLGLVLVSCGGLGYLGYLESRDSDDTAGAPAVVDLPVTAGAPVRFELPNTDGRYAFFLVTDGVNNYQIEGRWSCSIYEEPTLLESWSGTGMYAYGADDDYPTWHHVGTEFMYVGAGSMQCIARFDAPDPLPAGSRLVVTEHIKPSDWF